LDKIGKAWVSVVGKGMPGGDGDRCMYARHAAVAD
jgi:hypothetical protein